LRITKKIWCSDIILQDTRAELFKPHKNRAVPRKLKQMLMAVLTGCTVKIRDTN
jgi:hypothetical protein